MGDRHGARLVLAVASLGWAVASLASGAVMGSGMAAFAGFSAARVLLGASQAATYPVAAAGTWFVLAPRDRPGPVSPVAPRAGAVASTSRGAHVPCRCSGTAAHAAGDPGRPRLVCQGRLHPARRARSLHGASPPERLPRPGRRLTDRSPLSARDVTAAGSGMTGAHSAPRGPPGAVRPPPSGRRVWPYPAVWPCGARPCRAAVFVVRVLRALPVTRRAARAQRATRRRR